VKVKLQLFELCQICATDRLTDILYSEYDKSAAVQADLPAVVCVITGSNVSNVY